MMTSAGWIVCVGKEGFCLEDDDGRVKVWLNGEAALEEAGKHPKGEVWPIVVVGRPGDDDVVLLRADAEANAEGAHTEEGAQLGRHGPLL